MELQKKIATAISQTDESIEILFSNYESLKTDTTTQFTDISKYIRFVNGEIHLGNSENQLSLKITDDRIVFKNGEVEMGYFQNNKLFAPEEIEIPVGWYS